MELSCEAFSQALARAFLAKFEQGSGLSDAPSEASSDALVEAWKQAKPIALGSLARGELCPKSDIDILFSGDHAAAGFVTRALQEEGIKIRSRVPEDPADWTKGVEAFDVLALLSAKALTPEGEAGLALQVDRLLKGIKKWRRAFVHELKRERRERVERYDSIANYLEPNLKHGPGGLRDISQALQLRMLYPERFQSPERHHALQVFSYYRKFFLFSRIRIHLAEGGRELLAAYEQRGVAEWFGYESSRDFMREIQKGLSRVSFYADVDFEHVRAPAKELKRFEASDFDFVSLAAWMEKEPSVLVQAKARDAGFRAYRAAVRAGEHEKARANEALGRLLAKTVDPLQPEDVAIALFRSRWIDLAVTDFKKIVGYVQHDQYHRYTVDAHILQAIREMKRVASRPTLLGRLGEIAKKLNREDWRILGWTALYHDVGKGSGGDHSDKSAVIARQDLAKWGVPDDSIQEVLWLIENHLELSQAAFRGNPAHPATWRALHAKGIEGRKLLRLAIFTAVDIRATNSEAYTPWKARLLADLVHHLEMPEAKKLLKLERALSKLMDESEAKGLVGSTLGLLDRLDPFLIAALPTAVLARDLVDVAVALRMGREAAAIRVVRIGKENRVWIRFHTQEDQPGLFARYARALQSAGLSV
ncbi:MAG: HD domain-containing protein, partial [Bdellovibrionales bacterium]|nr:HD domain-containing protein [Bdellovibrionales bacterium]